MKFSFADVDCALATVHEIREPKRKAFTARLQNLQKHGFPTGTNTGRGRRASYEPGHVVLIGIALELIQLGLTPERAVNLIRSNMAVVRAAAAVSAEPSASNKSEFEPVVLYFNPLVLKSTVDPVEDDLWTKGSFSYGSPADAVAWLNQRWETEIPRAALFSVSDMILQIVMALCPDQTKPFWSAVAAWADAPSSTEAVPHVD